MALSYTLPQAWLQKIKMSNVSFSLSADNIFVVTKYPGYDPELTAVDPQNIGVDFFSYPRPRKFTAGLNINF